ncbi:MAG: YbhN family protein, partial [Halodesulfurarchaeum sp.]
RVTGRWLYATAVAWSNSMDTDLPKVLLGFLGTLVVLGALVAFVGVGDFLAAFRLLDLRALLVLAGVGIAWLVSWGLSLRTVLRSLALPVSTADSVLLYASAAFANNVTPFGQAGGEPISALLISRTTDTEYEQGLAAIASVDSLNFVPSIVLALLGLAYYVARFTVGDRILLVLGVVIALAVGIPLAGYLVWRHRERVKGLAVRALTPAIQAVARVVPSVGTPESIHVHDRIAGFYRAIGRVATGRGNLLLALGFSAIGWLLLCLALWLSLWALGHPVPVAIVFVVVPVGTIASIAPLPGGAGGVEAATVLLLVPTTGVTAATAGAAAIIYRGATYWLPTVLGGLAAAWLQARTRR